MVFRALVSGSGFALQRTVLGRRGWYTGSLHPFPGYDRSSVGHRQGAAARDAATFASLPIVSIVVPFFGLTNLPQVPEFQRQSPKIW